MAKDITICVVGGNVFSTRDTIEHVRKCLSCPLPKCVNCIGSLSYKSKRPAVGKYHHFTPEEQALLRHMIKSGKTYEEICSVIYIGRTKYYNLKKEVIEA